MKIGLAIHELHRNESALYRQLRHLSDTYSAEAEISHVARDLAQWSHRHVAELAVAGRGYGLDLSREPADDAKTDQERAGHADDLLQRHHESTVLLLHYLRDLHVATAGVNIDWDLLAQATQAARDSESLKLVQRCQPDTVRQLRWSEGQLKIVSPQILMS